MNEKTTSTKALEVRVLCGGKLVSYEEADRAVAARAVRVSGQ